MLGRIYSAKRVDIVIAHRAWLHVARLIVLCREGDVVDLALLARLPGVILVLSRCCIVIRWHLEAGVLKIKSQGRTQYLLLGALRLDLFALLVGLVDQPYEAECSGRLCKVGRWVEWLWSSLKWVSTKRLTRIL